MKFGPKEIKELNEYLRTGRNRKREFLGGNITFASDMARPEPKREVVEIDAFNEFNKRNPQADGGRIGFNAGGAVAIRKYLKGLKKGSTVNIRNYLDKNKLTTKNQRSAASASFTRILEEFEDKNFKVITPEQAYDQKVPLTKDQIKIAKKVYKDEIKNYDSFNDWQRDTKNKYKVSDIRTGQTTLETKPTGIIKDDPNRIRIIAKRGQEMPSDVIFPDKKMPSGKTMKQEFLDDLDEKFSKPKGQGLQNKDFVKKYPISKRQVQRVINYYIRKKNLKYPKADPSKTMQAYGTRKERFGPVTDFTTEETISKKIKRPILEERGMVRSRGTRPGVAVIDFAHRISKDHAKALGIQFGTVNTGFDSRLINQIIVKPSEIRLENFYKTQRDILDKIKSKGATKELIEEMNTINRLINKEVKKTSGRLLGVNIDPVTQEVSFTGQKKKFRLSNLNKTFKEIREIPYDERINLLRKEVAKSVDAEIKRGFRPFDFKEILGDPKNRRTLLKYAKENAPDIFSKFKNILKNPFSKRRFALYSNLPAAAIPAGIIMSLADTAKKKGIGFNQEFEQTADLSDGMVVPKGLSTKEKIATGTAGAALGLTKPVQRAMSKVLTPLTVPLIGLDLYDRAQAMKDTARNITAMEPGIQQDKAVEDFAVGDYRGYGMAGGGIATLAGVDKGPPPERGPDPQGLSSLKKRGMKI